MSSYKAKHRLEPKPLGKGGQAEVFRAEDRLRNTRASAFSKLALASRKKSARLRLGTGCWLLAGANVRELAQR
jgi:hypothetical protein